MVLSDCKTKIIFEGSNSMARIKKTFLVLVGIIVFICLFEMMAVPVYAGSDAEKCKLFYKQEKYKEAFPYCKKAAERGNTIAQNLLGVMYASGDGVEKNAVKAIKWYQKAAEQGNSYAQCNLGLMYYWGQGAEKDYIEAAKWLRKAAENGIIRAQYNLGVMYFKGVGGVKDMKMTKKWWKKSHQNGNADAAIVWKKYKMWQY